jgi:hypothetical protein
MRALCRPINLLVVGILTLIACSPEPGTHLPRFYAEHFDGSCDGLPCGWTQLSGAPGAAHTTATLLPDLRGLALVGDGVLVDGPHGEASPHGYLGDALDVVLIARCDPGASLIVRVALTSTVPPDGSADAVAALLTARLTPPPIWTRRWDASGEVRETLVPDAPLPVSGVAAHVESLTIQKDGPGQCELDSLLIERRDYADLYGLGAC